MIRRMMIAAVLLLANSACARLAVQVDVLNPTYMRATTTSSELAQGGHGRAEAFLQASRATLVAFRATCFNTLIAGNAAIANDATRPAQTRAAANASAPLLASARDAASGIDALIERERRTLYAADRAALIALGATGDTLATAPSAKPARLGQLEAILAQRENSYAASAQRLAAEVARNDLCPRNLAPQPADQSAIDAAAKTAQAQVQEAKAPSIIGTGVLLNEMNEAYFVATAHKSLWAPRYNRAVGSGAFGSTSIAIKMNDTADFSIKGFVFDGRSTADMVKKLGVQAVSTVAAMYGAPIGLAKTGTPPATAPSFDATALISAPSTTIAVARAEDAAYRATLFQVADSVMSNWDKLAARDATAKSILSATFDAQKTPYTTDPKP